MRSSVVLLIALFVISLLVFGDAKTQVLTAPPVVDQRQDMSASKPKSATPGLTAPSATSTAERVPSANPLWTIPLGSLAATRDHPLFSPSRRPPPPVVATKAPAPSPPPPKPAEPEKPQLFLVGTVLGENGERIGLFNSPDPKFLRLKVGENHKGWVLREVRGREVVLEKGQQNAVLELPRHDVSKGGSVPPPAAQVSRKTDPIVDEVAATSPSPNINLNATGGFPGPPPTGAPAVASMVIQPQVLTPRPPLGNPFADQLQKARLR